MKLIMNHLHCSNSDKVYEFHCHQQDTSPELVVPKSSTTIMIQQISCLFFVFYLLQYLPEVAIQIFFLK